MTKTKARERLKVKGSNFGTYTYKKCFKISDFIIATFFKIKVFLMLMATHFYKIMMFWFKVLTCLSAFGNWNCNFRHFLWYIHSLFSVFWIVYIEASWKIFKFLWSFKFLKSLKFLIIFLWGKKMLMIVMILTLMKYCEE